MLFNVSAKELGNVTIGEESYDSLAEAVQDATSGDVIEINSGLTESATIDVNCGVTIKGNGNSVSFESFNNTTSGGLQILTSEEVVIDNLELNSNAVGVVVNSAEHHLTVKDSIFTVKARGISVNNQGTQNSTIDVLNTIIQTVGVDNFDEELGAYVDNYTRGISLLQWKNSVLNVKNSTIQGFYYAINFASDNFDCENTEVYVENTDLKGRASLNIWPTLKYVLVKNCNIHGINNFAGTTESFANVVINQGASVKKMDVIDSIFTVYENETVLNNPKAMQFMFSVRSLGSSINLLGATQFIDNTGKWDTLVANGVVEEENTYRTNFTYGYGFVPVSSAS
ncbi:MAG: hypothetical protein IJ809_00385 [Clostridia bacterium]|nr:hypothetical protein [Clostridia bacterium]